MMLHGGRAVSEARSSDRKAVPHTALPVEHADRALVVRMLAGDEAAFRSLVGALHPLLLRLASTIVRSVCRAAGA